MRGFIPYPFQKQVQTLVVHEKRYFISQLYFPKNPPLLVATGGLKNDAALRTSSLATLKKISLWYQYNHSF